MLIDRNGLAIGADIDVRSFQFQLFRHSHKQASIAYNTVKKIAGNNTKTSTITRYVINYQILVHQYSIPRW